MKKNFLITTGIPSTWEFNENNYLLGKWCEFYEFDTYTKEIPNNKPSNNITIIKNNYHWNDNKKKIKDYDYIKKLSEYFLDIISEKLSKIHNIEENKEYWRVVISTWLDQYITVIFDRWESTRIFFEKNAKEKFYTNVLPLVDKNYLSKDHLGFLNNTQKESWNHLIFLRLFSFLNIKNLLLIEKKIPESVLKKEFSHPPAPYALSSNNPLRLFLRLVDKLVSKSAFKFNKIIFDNFYFPKNEFLRICLRCNLIPSKYTNLFNPNIQSKNLVKNDKRSLFKSLIYKIESNDEFVNFLIKNIHKDIPKSYIEDFYSIKKYFLPFAQNTKIIFSMHSLFLNDNFKIYTAEAKKKGTKFIYVIHGGGLAFKMDPRFNFFQKVSDKIISWDNTSKFKNINLNLSPTLPVIKLKKKSPGKHCSIIYNEYTKYLPKFLTGPSLEQSIDIFEDIVQFINKLEPNIKNKIKFRSKMNVGHNAEKKFSEIFGSKYLDKVSINNSFLKTIYKSKLIITTYAQTAFSESMYSDTPTMLIIKKNHCLFSESASNIFDDLKKNKIAFHDFEEAREHVNKYWNNLDIWWRDKNVQSSRKNFLNTFFNVKPNWYKEWSDFIFHSQNF